MGLKRLIAITVSVLLLAALFATLDLGKLGAALRGVDGWWFGLGLLLFVPQILVIASRWSYITRPLAHVGLGESVRQVLAASSLNLVLPSKLGDLAKGVFLFRQGRCRFAEGMNVVVFEKLMDLYALSLWMVLGWLLFPSLEWWVVGMLGVGLSVMAGVTVIYFQPMRRLLSLMPGKVKQIGRYGPRVMMLIDCFGRRRAVIFLYSMVIWLLHLLQIHCFLLSVGVELGLIEVVARMPIPLFAGLLPLTMAGFGTRDWAIVAVFVSAANPPEVLVAGALLISLRYVIPALGGLPFLASYLALGREAQARQCQGNQ